jgi:hypothetical protein
MSMVRKSERPVEREGSQIRDPSRSLDELMKASVYRYQPHTYPKVPSFATTPRQDHHLCHRQLCGGSECVLNSAISSRNVTMRCGIMDVRQPNNMMKKFHPDHQGFGTARMHQYLDPDYFP